MSSLRFLFVVFVLLLFVSIGAAYWPEAKQAVDVMSNTSSELSWYQ